MDDKTEERVEELTEAAKHAQELYAAFNVENLLIAGMDQTDIGRKANDSLRKVRAYAEAQLNYEELLVKLEELTSLVKTKHRDLTETIIPELMESLDLPGVPLANGVELKIERKIRAALSKDRAPEGCKYLREHGASSIIKHEIAVNLGTKSQEEADKIKKVLIEAGQEPEVRETVHHSTLTSWVRHELEDGQDIPFDLFGVFSRTVSVIK